MSKNIEDRFSKERPQFQVRTKTGRSTVTAEMPSDYDRVRTKSLEAVREAVVQAHYWTEMYERGEVKTLKEICQYTKWDESVLSKRLNLVNLAPDITAAILNRDAPPALSLNILSDSIPLDWNEQRRKYGFIA